MVCNHNINDILMFQIFYNFLKYFMAIMIILDYFYLNKQRYYLLLLNDVVKFYK